MLLLEVSRARKKERGVVCVREGEGCEVGSGAWRLVSSGGER